MVLLADDSITIDRAPDEVYDYATNLDRFGEWFPGVRHIESANALPHGEVGKQYRETVAIPLRGERRILVTVTQAERGRRFVTEGRFRPLLPRMEIGFAATREGATRVEWRMYSRSEHAAVRWLLAPLARRVMRQRAREGLIRLQQRLESGAGSA